MHITVIRPARPKDALKSRETGFTLTELTIVLVIVTLLVGGMLLPLSAQRDLRDIADTQKRLSDINEALLGFAAANGRLPCPAAPETTGVESPEGGGDCTNDWNGFLPAITLGIGPTDAQGYAIDAWNNRLRYAVTTANASAFTTGNEIRNSWAAGLSPNLRVCSTSKNISNPGTSNAECPAADRLTNSAVAVIISAGKNGAALPGSNDELANWPTSNDRVFVNAASPGFDDIVAWISPNILFNRMIAAGRLP